MEENKEVVLSNQEVEAFATDLTQTHQKAEVFWPDMSLLVAPDKRLNIKSSLVTPEEFANGSIIELTNTMDKAMGALKGIGLSAIQVNVPKQVFVISHRMSGDTQGHRIFVNPIITNMSPNTVFIEEGCLSFPGLYVPVHRSEGLTIEAQDEKGESFKMYVEGFGAVLLQHEYDHLQGITFLDKISKLKRDFYKKKYEKIRAKRDF